MKKFNTNPLATFDGAIMPIDLDCLDEPDWDALILGPCINTPARDDGDDEPYEE